MDAFDLVYRPRYAQIFDKSTGKWIDITRVKWIKCNANWTRPKVKF